MSAAASAPFGHVLAELTDLFTNDASAEAHALRVLKRINVRLDRDPLARTNYHNTHTPFGHVWDYSGTERGTEFSRREPARYIYTHERSLFHIVPRASASKAEVAAACVANGIALRKSWTRKQMIQAILKA